MFKAFLVILFSLHALSLCAAEPAALSLDAVLQAVRAQDPVVAEARARAREAAGMARSAHAWMPPTLGLELMGLPWPGPDFGQSRARRWTLSQALPFPGRTWTAGKAADHRAEAMHQDAETTLQSRLAEARGAYFAWLGAQRALDGLERVDQADHEMAALSAKRGSFGQLDRMGQFMDSMLAMEASDVDSLRPMLQQEVRAARARLATLMGLEGPASLGAPSLDLDAWLAEPLPSAAAVQAAVERDNPSLQAAQASLQAAQAARSVAQAGWLPDLMLQGGVTENGSAGQESSAMLSMSLPWAWAWGQVGAIRAATARRDAALAGLQAQRLSLRLQAQTALQALGALTEALRITWTQTYPKAQRGLELARNGFRTTALGPSDILMAVKDYRMTEEKLGRLIAQRGQAQALLQQLSAGAIEASASQEHPHE